MSNAKIVKGMSTASEVRLVVDLLKDHERNDGIVSHEDIERAIGHPRSSSRYRSVMEAAKKVLLGEHRIAIDGMSARGQGWRVLAANSAVTHGRRSVRRAARALNRGKKLVLSAPDEELTEPERRNRDNVLFHLANLAGAALEASREMTSQIRLLEAPERHPSQRPTLSDSALDPGAEVGNPESNEPAVSPASSLIGRRKSHVG